MWLFLFFFGGVEVWEKEIVAAVTLRCASSRTVACNAEKASTTLSALCERGDLTPSPTRNPQKKN